MKKSILFLMVLALGTITNCVQTAEADPIPAPQCELVAATPEGCKIYEVPGTRTDTYVLWCPSGSGSITAR